MFEIIMTSPHTHCYFTVGLTYQHNMSCRDIHLRVNGFFAPAKYIVYIIHIKIIIYTVFLYISIYFFISVLVYDLVVRIKT